MADDFATRPEPVRNPSRLTPPRKVLKAGPAAERAWRKRVEDAQAEANRIEGERRERERLEVKAGVAESVKLAEARAEDVAKPKPGEAGPTFVGRDGLLWLLRKRRILAPHFDAGMRFRADFERAHGTGPKSNLKDFGAPAGGFGSATGATDAMLIAKGRVEDALAALGTPLLHGYLVNVAGLGLMLTDPEVSRDPKKPDLLPVLIALDLAARHYGLLK